MKSTPPSRRFWLRALPLILLPLLLALFGLIAWAGLSGEPPRFDPAAWRAAQTANQLREQRYDVLDDLRQNYLRYGTTRAQVLEWLGAPPGSPPGASSELVYPVGAVGLFLPDSYVLAIRFDQEGRLLETELQQDQD